MSNSDHHKQSELKNLSSISPPIMDAIKSANATMDRINLNIAKQEARDQVEMEIGMLKSSLTELKPMDRKAIGINKRIDYLLSPRYQNYLDAKCQLKQVINNIGREIFYGLCGFAKLLLVIALNLVALLLLLVWFF
ncbi:hypothetical protein H8K33_12555 [Undibacterium amnicola]|uniref:Uncharacterized protein n=1 Tax=Undibacterium amnicola TaxID=1834038 RepID=A0ABR6XSA2_9BURK|nr:hypothetical protein [Undibacterium amnicola]MBC3832347.1 hypothetical protein [Undibacterium amnicola]